MRKKRFTEHQIIKVLKQVEGGRSASEVLRLPPFLNHQLMILRWNLQFLFTTIDKSVCHYF